MRRSEQLINVTNVDEQEDHDDYNVDVGDCAEDFDVGDEPAISSSVSLNTRHYERLQRAEDTWATASVNSTCVQPPPPGNCGAFAPLVSPGGGAFANFCNGHLPTPGPNLSF